MATSEQTFAKGMQILSAGNEELGLQFLERACAMDPSNVEMLRALGETCMELNHIDQGKEALLRCAQLDPNEFSIYMYLGQAETGKEALQYYEKGIELLKKETDEPELQRQLALAYCTVAELYMSDLCYEPDAEAKCEEALKLSLELSPSNPQALQGTASLLLSQSKSEEAKPFVLQAFTIIDELTNARDRLLDLDEEEDENEMGDEGALNLETIELLMPPYEFRAGTCRLLIEIGEYEKAISLLESLLNENDEIAEVWMLIGHANIALKKKSDALEALEKAEEVYSTLLSLDASIAEDVQFKSMKTKIAEFKKQAENL